ncbi:MAG: serine/threonine-protein kinase, partial [Myxococcota bacterium]
MIQLKAAPPRLLIEIGSQFIDRYTILGQLGRGGFAVVLEARDDLIERPVAIKCMDALMNVRDDTLHSSMLARFYKEAKAAASIDHPNILTIYDVGQTEDFPFIVMELLRGHDFRHELREHGAMKPERALPLFLRCLDALAVGHEQGIVHRDLKPSNLFITQPHTPQEDVRVVDFGIAVLGEFDTRLTASDQMYGTTAYLAPEYILHKEVTPAVDVYQMGLILIELLTGQKVVKADTKLASVVKHTNGDFFIPAELLNGDLGEILARALALDSKSRYPNAAVFRDALSAIDPSTIAIPEGEQRAEPLKLIDYAARLKPRALDSESQAKLALEPSGPVTKRQTIAYVEHATPDDTPSGIRLHEISKRITGEQPQLKATPETPPKAPPATAPQNTHPPQPETAEDTPTPSPESNSSTAAALLQSPDRVPAAQGASAGSDSSPPPMQGSEFRSRLQMATIVVLLLVLGVTFSWDFVTSDGKDVSPPSNTAEEIPIRAQTPKEETVPTPTAVAKEEAEEQPSDNEFVGPVEGEASALQKQDEVGMGSKPEENGLAADITDEMTSSGKIGSKSNG